MRLYDSTMPGNRDEVCLLLSRRLLPHRRTLSVVAPGEGRLRILDTVEEGRELPCGSPRVAPEGGFDPSALPPVRSSLARVSGRPGRLPMTEGSGA